MAGSKRARPDMEINPKTEHSSPYIPMFETFRAELDEHHDRRERVIKASRDITALSKKIIFSLQRVRELNQPIHASISKHTDPLYNQIRDLFVSISSDLQGINAWRYQRNISGGIDEYMEAVLFQHYLASQSIPSLDAASKALPQSLTLVYEDYVSGLFDMTGELMRFAITYMATNGKLPGASSGQDGEGGVSVLADMQMIRSQLELLDTHGSYGLSREFEKKLATTRQSVEKIENGVYSMTVRGKERPKGWRPDLVDRETEQLESNL